MQSHIINHIFRMWEGRERVRHTGGARLLFFELQKSRQLINSLYILTVRTNLFQYNCVLWNFLSSRHTLIIKHIYIYIYIGFLSWYIYWNSHPVSGIHCSIHSRGPWWPWRQPAAMQSFHEDSDTKMRKLIFILVKLIHVIIPIYK